MEIFRANTKALFKGLAKGPEKGCGERTQGNDAEGFRKALRGRKRGTRDEHKGIGEMTGTKALKGPERL